MVAAAAEERSSHHGLHALEPAEEPLPDLIPQDDPATREPEESHAKRLAHHNTATASADSSSDLERQPHPHQNENEKHSPPLHRIQSHISTHDAIVTAHHHDMHYEPGDEIYDRFSPKRKTLIVTILSFCSFLAPISSTSILAASAEVVQTYHTTPAIFGYSNALYLIFMGLSPLFWGPLGQTFGRKWTLAASAVTFCAFSIGTALAPSLAVYFVMRVLTAFSGTSFLIVGAAVVGDVYRPVERGTAYGWFLSGTLIGPALGP